MASPQIENGYTKLANELYEHIVGFSLTGYQLRVVFTIIRKTYGFGKKMDKISLSQISEITHIKKSHVCRSIKELKSMNIVTTDGNKIGINKNYDSWLTVTTDGNSKKTIPLPPMVIGVTTDGNKSLPPAALQKKRNILLQKKYINRYPNLEDLQEKDFEEIAQKYQVPLSFVKSKFDDMEIWAGSRPGNKKLSGRNWRLTLMGFVKRDSLQLRREAMLHESKRGIDARNIE